MRESTHQKNVQESSYNDTFYESQMDGSYRSAVKYVAILGKFFKPRSVVDLGCGRGTWLKAFRESGAEKVVGFDGPWNSQENMVDQSIKFYRTDLNDPISISTHNRFDLAMSLEVAEHLHPASAQGFVEALAGLSDVVIFGAAYVAQGGTGHHNEKPPSYWATFFKSRGYATFDIFRHAVWGNEEIAYWYQQNTFLYVKTGSSAYHALTVKGLEQLENLEFMNCVHPQLYQNKLDALNPGFLLSMRGTLAAFSAALKRRTSGL